MENYFVIGGGALQKDFVELVKSKGYLTHVFDYDPNCICAAIADQFHCISIDAKEEILILAQKFNPVAVQTVATEMGNVTACFVGEKMGLNNCSYQTALETTDKSLMKEVFLENKIPSAKYLSASKVSDVDVPALNFPLVIKASDRSAGRGISLAKNETEFEVAFQEALDESINKIVLIEEYIIGKQYSVESVSFKGEHNVLAITEEFTSGAPDFIEEYHLVPARVSAEVNNEITEFIKNVLDVFKVNWGASHIELLATDSGFKVIEVASRMGGLRDILIKLSSGMDYLELILNASVGLELSVISKFRKHAIVKMILDESDYNDYKKLKEEKGNILKVDHVNKEVNFKNKARNLMHSQGYYYLQLDDEKDIESYLN